jgi:hypothetical protein
MELARAIMPTVRRHDIDIRPDVPTGTPATVHTSALTRTGVPLSAVETVKGTHVLEER